MSNRVQNIPKHVNLSKKGNRKFTRNQYFLLLIEKKGKNLKINWLMSSISSILKFSVSWHPTERVNPPKTKSKIIEVPHTDWGTKIYKDNEHDIIIEPFLHIKVELFSAISSHDGDTLSITFLDIRLIFNSLTFI